VFNVIQTGHSKNILSEEESKRKALLNLRDKVSNLYYSIVDSAIANSTGVVIEERTIETG
jgi:hypothetical protein